jgi:RimJ/RimL family protein N-acetyltransferase
VRTLTPPDPPLRDAELALRPPAAADGDAYRRVRTDPDTRHWMDWDDAAEDKEAIAATIARAAESWAEGTWAVFLVEAKGEVVGGANIGFYEEDIAEVSYYLAASARGRGYATRAVRLLARWAFEENGVERLVLRANPANGASLRVAERAGFTREGIARSSHLRSDGSRVDQVVFSLLPGELA